MSLDGELGTIYSNGQNIAVQGETGECMYVIQSGKAEVLLARDGHEVLLSVLETGDVFGEMSLFTRKPRVATVRALGDVRVMKIDKRGFMRRVHQDPSLAFRILQKMSLRLAAVDEELAQLKESQPALLV
ncbi:MAG: cyclic nucleotide-binding domain-containing protein [Thermoanaerobaculia bacterium]